LKFSPSKIARDNKAQALFRNADAKAMRNDPEFQEMYELAYLDHLLGGYMHLQSPAQMGKRSSDTLTRKDGSIVQRKLSLGSDDIGAMPESERIEMRLANLDNKLTNELEGASTDLDADEVDYIMSLLDKWVLQSDINKIGYGGTQGRKDADGKIIKVSLPSTQRKAIAQKHLKSWLKGSDDEGSQLYGNPLDVAHGVPSSLRPDKAGDIDNLNLRPAGDNRAESNAENVDKLTRLIQRRNNLHSELIATKANEEYELAKSLNLLDNLFTNRKPVSIEAVRQYGNQSRYKSPGDNY
jgi:hypothetical protein